MTCRAVLGCDVALRHAGLVLLGTDDQVLGAWALVQAAGDRDKLAAAGVRVQRQPSADQKATGPGGDLLRLATLRGWLESAVGEAVALGASRAVLEGVGFHHGSSQASVAALYQAHALARLALADAGVPHEVVDPNTIGRELHGGRRLPKGETKTAAARVVRERWGVEWIGDGEGDLVDAYVLARAGRRVG